MTHPLKAAALAIVVAGAGTSFAQPPAHPLPLGPLGAREQLLAHFDGLPEPQLRAVFLRCARESSRRLLDLDEAVPCAMAWDELLVRGYGGDVEALLAWWRAQRDR